MDVEQEQKSSEQLQKWFSTYGLITAQRLLGHYDINLPDDLLISAVKNPLSFYHQLLQIPLKNVLNGIVIQQAYDYHIYAQKLFIDYLLSGDSAETEDGQGGASKEALEEERKDLITLGEQFHELEMQQEKFIASTQDFLMKIAKAWNETLERVFRSTETMLSNAQLKVEKGKIKQAVYHALTNSNLSESNKSAFIASMNEVIKAKELTAMEDSLIASMRELIHIAADFDVNYKEFSSTLEELSLRSRSFRTQFYDTIIRVLDLIKLLPTYKIDPVQDSINREPLYFDKTIGGK